jgi:DNA-binding MarR family transcriptional regulator
MSAVELTMAQTKALYVIIAADHLRMSELAARLGVTSSTATGQIDGLVELGLVERRVEPADRRHVVVAATPAALTLLERIRELNSRRMREMLARVDADDLPTIERAIALLDAAVTAELAEGASATTTVTVTDQKGTRS